MTSSSSSSAVAHDHEDYEVKKGRPLSPDPEAEDTKYVKEKGHDDPPRFSTIFASPPSPPPLPARQPIVHAFESYPEPKRRSPGVFMPTPLFILFVGILLFESTILFAYTVIGLYNSVPTALLLHPTTSCDCVQVDKQPIVNIAPNFVMPGPAAVTEKMTLYGTGMPNIIATAMATTVSLDHTTTGSTPSSVSSTPTSTSSAAAAVSNILGIFSGLTASTTASPSLDPGAATSTVILSQVFQQSTVESVTVITVNPAGSTVLPVRPTVTSTKIVQASARAA